MERLVARFLQETTGKAAQVKSQALTPALWILGICATGGVSLLLLGDGWVQVFGAILVSVLVVFAISAYCYFAVKDPDRLGSEAFVIRRHTLGIIEQKGDATPTFDAPGEIPGIKEPPAGMPLLEREGDDG